MLSLSRFRHLFGVILFLLVASCSGGGCAQGCSGCGGTTPLPGGFPTDKTVENAASVRLSRPGLDFVEKNLPAIAAQLSGAPGGIMAIGIPTTPINQPNAFLSFDVTGSVCPGGPDPNSTPPRCTASANIAGSSFQIDAVKPNALQIRATVPLELDDTPVNLSISFINPTVHIGYGANGDCVGPNDAAVSVDPKALPVVITIPLVEETTAPRAGYTKIDIDNAVIDLDAVTGDDVQICADCGILNVIGVCNAVLNWGFLKNFVVNTLKSGLGDQMKAMLADALCTAPVPTLNPACPEGSSPDDAGERCVYDTDRNKCVPTLLGTDAHVDLGGLLASISPGTAGGVDFGLAASGAMRPLPGADPDAQGRTPNGVTLGMLGGVLPQPPSTCVPQATLTRPTGIPIPDELAPTTADATGTPHVGIALSGRFLDYAIGNVYNSGLFCLGVGTDQFAELRAGLLSLVVPSLKTLAYQQADAAVAIATRPQEPPTIALGGGTDLNADPLLLITMPRFAVDFYVWHLDRFVRAFTFQADLKIPVNLQTGKDPITNPAGGIVPTLGDIAVSGASVTNADLLTDDPALIASALQGLLGGISKQLLGGGIPPIDLSSALASFGLGMEIDQIKKLTKGTDDFVGVFATLSKTAGAATAEADTRARIVSKKVDAAHMQLATMTREARPELIVEVSSPLEGPGRDVEYTWWIDRGTRAPWGPGPRIVISDDQLFLQGRHVLHVAARLRSAPSTEDVTPATLPFTIDALAPFVTVDVAGPSGARVAHLEAWDVVSEKKDLRVRYRLDEGEPSALVPVEELGDIAAGGASSIEVEVHDEEGNIRTVRQSLIRGKVDGSLASDTGCGCDTPGGRGDRGGLAALSLGALALGAVFLRRRRATKPADAKDARDGAMHAPRRLATRGSAARAALALASVVTVAATSQGCGCGSEDGGTQCGPDCQQECLPPLALGRPGSYTSIAKAPDGALWVAGYNEALVFEGDSALWGDLVVGRYDMGKEQVDWQTVDGLPVRDDTTCADHPADSWRNGERDSGDDVGMWTSIQVPPSGHPVVSYYDATNKRLKVAVFDGEWKTMTLLEQAGADVGRMSKMVLENGKPSIAFLVTESGSGGGLRSRIVVARAKVETPRAPNDFVIEDAAIEEENPCTTSSCGGGAVCVRASGVCTPQVSGCDPRCTSGTACVDVDGAATCVALRDNLETITSVFGARLSYARNGEHEGVAVYDAPRGNLVAVINRGGGRWERFLVDGETGSRADGTAIDTGDVGQAVTLAIDTSGTWHMAYVSGLDETLRYVTFADGKPGRPEVIDDGSAVDGKPFPDGKHVVGDDASIRVDGDVITIVYQDNTVGTLRRAIGKRSGSTRTWELRSVAQPGRFAGFFPHLVPGEDRIANFWETADRQTKNFVGDVAIVTP